MQSSSQRWRRSAPTASTSLVQHRAVDPGHRTRPALAGIGLIAVIFLLGACGGSEGSADEQPKASGSQLYAQNCASCHGADLGGTSKGPSHLSQVYEPNHHPDAAFRSAIAGGAQAHHWNFGDMPPVEGLTEEEVDAIISFIRDQQGTLGFEPYPPG